MGEWFFVRVLLVIVVLNIRGVDMLKVSGLRRELLDLGYIPFHVQKRREVWTHPAVRRRLVINNSCYGSVQSEQVEAVKRFRRGMVVYE